MFAPVEDAARAAEQRDNNSADSSRRAQCMPTAILFAIIQLGCVLPFLSLYDISSSSEAREAHVMRSVLVGGEWIFPRRNDVVPSKPPFTHWVGASLGHLLGQSDVEPWLSRLPSALAGALVVALTITLFSRILTGGEGLLVKDSDRRFLVVLPGVILGLSYEFIRLQADARVDMMFCLWVTLALVSVLMPLFSLPRRERSALSPLNWIVFYGSAGCAVLSKGPLGIVLPFVLVATAFTMFFGVKQALKLCLQPRWGWLLFIIIVGPWYVMAYQRGGEQFLSRVLFENVERFAGGEHVNSQPMWFYLKSILRSQLPWSLIALFTIPFILERLRSDARRMPRYSIEIARYPEIVFLGMSAVGLALFSLSSGKRHSYLLPLFPLIALSLSCFLVRLWAEAKESTRFSLSGRIQTLGDGALILLVTCILVLEAALFSYIPDDPLHLEIKSWVAGQSRYLEVVILFSLGIYLLLRQQVPSIMSTGFLLAFTFSLFIALGLGVKANFKGFVAHSNAIRSIIGANELSVIKRSADEYFDPILYYLKRPVGLRAPRQLLECTEGEFLLLHASDRNLLERRVEEVRRFNEVDDELRGIRERELVLVRCLVGGSFSRSGG